MSDFFPVPEREKHGEFLRAVVEMVFGNVVFANGRDKVVLWERPEKLAELFDFGLGQTGLPHEKLLTLIKNTIKFSVKTGHPYFINQLFSGLDPYGLAGQWLTDALNASVYTYEVAPVFTLMETEVVKEMCRMVGPDWKDGLFCPGGSFANGTAINLARHSVCPEFKDTGGYGMPRFVVFASEECHYSISKFIAFVGLGQKNLVLIKTDDVGTMNVQNLEESIQNVISNGGLPLAVVATLGTTVRGAFDPLQSISAICTRYGLWLHVDAAWGGGLIFSQKHRAKLNGLEKADSVVVNPHKLLAVPQQCSLLLIKDSDALRSCHAEGAEYLFQKDKAYDGIWDLGDKYLQCGRKCDVFKFWLMWKAKGSSGFANHIDKLMDLAEYFEEQVKLRPDFQLVSPRQYMNVCFWYLPKYLHGKKLLPENLQQLHKVAPLIKEFMLKQGSVMLSYQPLKEFPNFFRFVAQNSVLGRKDVDFILDHISDIGAAIFK